MCSIILFLIIFVTYVSGQTYPVVDTSVGQIVGVKDDFIKFLGIPYAVVDEKDPFGAAKPPLPFDTPYYANQDPVICPQLVNGIPQGNIQCLHLNVYTPISDNSTSTWPVMVYIHGGGFTEGDGNFKTYSPKFLVKKDVIVVTLNYRLGPYGFLCLDEEEYNNQGLKDQILALKWVKKNIESFGGDANNIVLFSHSAGSAATEYHLLYTKDNLFNKVILEAMQLVSPLLYGRPANLEFLTDIAEKIGLDAKQLETLDVIKALSAESTDLVVGANFEHKLRPCIKSLVLADVNDLKDMKIIIGSAERETVFIYKDRTDYSDIIKSEMEKEFDDIDKGIKKVEDFYKTDIAKEGALKFSCDFMFNYPIERAIRYYLKRNATVYRYLFRYDGGRNFMKVRDGIEDVGATHGDELGYLFDSDIFEDKIRKEDQLIIDYMTSYWTNFAKYGVPSPSELSDLTPWPQVEHNMNLMILTLYPHINKTYGAQQMCFWDHFYKYYGVKSKSLRYPEESFKLMENAVGKSTIRYELYILAIVVVTFLV